MIVIYTQEFTAVKSNAEEAKDMIFSLYGDKLGNEAYETIKSEIKGMSYRKNGGPLIRVISCSDACEIRKREQEIGMLKV